MILPSCQHPRDEGGRDSDGNSRAMPILNVAIVCPVSPGLITAPDFLFFRHRPFVIFMAAAGTVLWRYWMEQAGFQWGNGGPDGERNLDRR